MATSAVCAHQHLFAGVMQVVAHAAYVNNKTKSNSSPLRFAVKNSHLRASEVLIKKGGADCLVTDSQVGP